MISKKRIATSVVGIAFSSINSSAARAITIQSQDDFIPEPSRLLLSIIGAATFAAIAWGYC